MDREQVLIVDDEELVVHAVMAMLEDEQIGSTGAADRATAIRIMENRFYPVIVADIRLRTEAEGLLLLDEIRALAPESRVVCMSGYVTDELEIEARRRGARFVVEKASCDTTLVAAVLELLAEIEEAAAKCDTLNLEQLYASTRALMHSIPMRRFGLSRAEAEDVVQEAWMLFLEKRGIVRYARGWLAGTVAKLSLRQRCRPRREVVDDDILEDAVDQRSTVWSDVVAVRAALGRVDTTSRTLCTLIGMEGYSYGEVTEKTGYAAGSIGPLYIRAKNRLRRELEH